MQFSFGMCGGCEIVHVCYETLHQMTSICYILYMSYGKRTRIESHQKVDVEDSDREKVDSSGIPSWICLPQLRKSRIFVVFIK